MVERIRFSQSESSDLTTKPYSIVKSEDDDTGIWLCVGHNKKGIKKLIPFNYRTILNPKHGIDAFYLVDRWEEKEIVTHHRKTTQYINTRDFLEDDSIVKTVWQPIKDSFLIANIAGYRVNSIETPDSYKAQSLIFAFESAPMGQLYATIKSARIRGLLPKTKDQRFDVICERGDQWACQMYSVSCKEAMVQALNDKKIGSDPITKVIFKKEGWDTFHHKLDAIFPKKLKPNKLYNDK